MKKYLLITILLASMLFTGCAKYEYSNGVLLPQPDEKKEYQQYKVYLDDSAIIKREHDAMEAYRKIVKEGVEFKVKKTRLGSLIDNYPFQRSFNGYPLLDVVKKGYDTSIKKLSEKDVYAFEFDTTKKDEVHTFSIDFKIDGRKLVSTKKYNTYTDIMIDIDYLAVINASQKVKDEVTSKYGFNKFIVDGDAFKWKKLVLIPVTKEFDIKTKMDSQLATRGYTVVQDKESANEVVELDVVAFARGYQLKGIKSKNYYETSLDRSVSAGATISNLGSTKLGLGVALLGAFFSPSNKMSVYHIITLKKDIEDGGERIIQLAPVPINNYTGIDIIYSGRFRAIRGDRMDIMYSKYSKKIARFIKYDDTRYSDDTTVKRR